MNAEMFQRSIEANITQFFVIFVALVSVSMVLKAVGLWRAARDGEKWWFVAIMFINSLGVLPIIYLITHPEKKGSK